MFLTTAFYAFMGSRSRPSRYVALLGVIIIYSVGLVIIAYLRWLRLEDYGHTAAIYHQYSLNLIQGQTPYRDFVFEYPPVALLAIVLPQLVRARDSVNLAEYAWLFLVENALISVLLGLTVVRIATYFKSRQCLTALAVYSLLSTITAPLLLGRYDLFPTLLMAIAVAAAIGGKPTLAGVWLGLGFAAKLYPIVLLPILSVYFWVSGSYRSLFKLVLGVSIAASVTVLPFLHIGTGQLLSFLHYHQLRGLQIESIPAGILLLGHMLGFTPVTVVTNFGASHIAASVIADAVLKWLPGLFLFLFTGVLIACVGCFRNEVKQFSTVTNESLLTFLTSALLSVIVAGKVLSPQYFGWLLPLVPFLRLRQAVLVGVIFVMTIVIYPFAYDSLIALHTPSILLLNARNILTIALLVWVVTERLSASNDSGDQKKTVSSRVA